MRVRLDDDQAAMVGQFESFLERECPREAVRDAASGPEGWSRRRLEQMAELGVLGVGVPEHLGGVGLGFVEAVALLEVAGRFCVPEPLMETIGVAVPLLVASLKASEAGSSELAGELLGRVCRGEAVVTVGFREGSVVRCPYMPGSDVVLAMSEEVVELLDPAGCEIAELGSIDATRRIGELSLERASATPIGVPYEACIDACAIASAAELVGLASAMLEMAIQHARERHQFGRPIGSFQAVKHALADVALGIEMARPVVWHAAWNADMTRNTGSTGEGSTSRLGGTAPGSGYGPIASRHGPSGLHASAAKALAAEAAVSAARTALQVHGAIGYTFEHDLHLWMKRAWTLATWGGNAAEHRSRVLSFLVGGQADSARYSGR